MIRSRAITFQETIEPFVEAGLARGIILSDVLHVRAHKNQATGAALAFGGGDTGLGAQDLAFEVVAPPRLRLKAAGMTERFPFGPASTARNTPPRCPFGRIAIYRYRKISNEIHNHWLICIPPFFLVNSVAPRIGAEQSRARSGEANP